jgi:hypothetical protein
MSTTNTWSKRVEIRSEASDRIYVVSQHATKCYGFLSPCWPFTNSAISFSAVSPSRKGTGSLHA